MKTDNNELERIFFNIRENKTNGIEELYSKYKKLVYSIAFTISKNKTDAEDIMQLVFTKIYEIDSSKLPTNNYSSWLYTITKNESINFLKKHKNNISLDNIYDISNNNDELNKLIDTIEFNNLINNLNNKEKEIISLKILSNFSFEEIAKLLNEPIGTVKWRYYKSIYSLKSLLGNLAIFIISFAIGIKVLFANKKSENFSQVEHAEDNSISQEEYNSTKSPENTFKDENKEFNNESSREENIIENENNIIQNTTNSTQENIISDNQLNNYYNQYVGYSFLGISIIFLIISLYIFIKYQLKHLIKLSK